MTSLHIHDLEGCSPTPLAHYLKALAVLRLVSAQVDASARGWWSVDRFHLSTTLSREELAEFFLDRYSPSPLVAPWNGGSGFYPKDNKAGVEAILNSQAPRLSVYREAIAAARQLTEGRASAPKKGPKEELLRHCRELWRGQLAAWLDAALVLGADGSPAYPALLGTGGNDGRLDFTNNFMQRLADLFDLGKPDAPATPRAALLLEGSLFGAPTPGLKAAKIGQFYPGSAGGANQGAGFSGASLVNPWDFVLMMEGALTLRASLVRRAESQELPQAAAPFALRASASGYGSAADSDEGARGEQWMPLWSTPTTQAELAQLFAEGRSKLGERTARRPLEFARSLARLGVARGIDAFERFGYIERNGQANLAVPLGRWSVRPQPHHELLDDVGPWVDRLLREARSPHAPALLRSAARRCEEAMLTCCRNSTSLHWRALLRRLAEAEQALLRSPKFSKDLRPLPRLSAGWLAALGGLESEGPEATELRLALSLASLHGISPEADASSPQRPQWRDPIRRHWIPLDLSPKSSIRYRRLRTTGDAIDRPQEVVGRGFDLLRDATLVLRRRAITRGRARALDLVPATSSAAARLSDIASFLRGEIDERRCLTLSLGLMAMDWPALRASAESRRLPAPTRSSELPGALYGVLRLATPFTAMTPPMQRPLWDPDTGAWRMETAPAIETALDPAILERLLAEDLPGAMRSALHRLRVAGLRPRLTLAALPPEQLHRLAASLLFPICDRDLHRLAASLTKPSPLPEPDEATPGLTEEDPQGSEQEGP